MDRQPALFPAAPPLPREEMDRAFQARDRAYDGLFYVGVTSTGVFCRPSCPARRPRSENVQYYPPPAKPSSPAIVLASAAGRSKPAARFRPGSRPSSPAWTRIRKRGSATPRSGI